jgi:hypothetical protein
MPEGLRIQSGFDLGRQLLLFASMTIGKQMPLKSISNPVQVTPLPIAIFGKVSGVSSRSFFLASCSGILIEQRSEYGLVWFCGSAFCNFPVSGENVHRMFYRDVFFPLSNIAVPFSEGPGLLINLVGV